MHAQYSENMNPQIMKANWSGEHELTKISRFGHILRSALGIFILQRMGNMAPVIAGRQQMFWNTENHLQKSIDPNTEKQSDREPCAYMPRAPAS